MYTAVPALRAPCTRPARYGFKRFPVMWNIIKRIAHVGIATEARPLPAAEPGDDVGHIQQRLLAILGKALAIRMVDAGSCNGCELEIHALGNPYYNLEGLGIRFVASPRHADMLLVTGPVSRHKIGRAHV